MKLTKLSAKFSKNSLKTEIFESINQALDALFWFDDVSVNQALRQQIATVKEGYTLQNLPFRTQDNEWLVNYVAGAFPHLPLTIVKKYVATSSQFKQKRDEYEQALTKAYIKIHKDEPENFYYPASVQNKERSTIVYDVLFRDGVMTAMTSLGLSKRNVEISLEKNRTYWLMDVREKTFWNILNSNCLTALPAQNLDLALVKEVRQTEAAIFGIWNALRESDYCCEHQKIMQEINVDVSSKILSGGKKKELIQKQHDLVVYYRDCLAACHEAGQLSSNAPVGVSI